MSEIHALQVSDLRFAYRGGNDVLHGISFKAQANRMLCVLGPNGSGKTTTLKCMLGMLKPNCGIVLLDGQDRRKLSAGQLGRIVAYVPQTPQTAFAFTVRQLVMLGRTAHMGTMGFETELDHRVVDAAMDMTGVSKFADRMLDELSGGEAQCVMIARAIAQQPSVLLLDEPTSHLDIRNQLMIYDMMRRLSHDWGMAIVCVSHDINLASRFADDLVLMRDGSIAAQGSPADVVNREVLSDVYDVEIDLIDVDSQEVPLVQARLG